MKKLAFRSIIGVAACGLASALIGFAAQAQDKVIRIGVLMPISGPGSYFGVMGIPLLVSMIQSERDRLHRLSIERKEISSEDDKIKVTVSGMWVKMPELNKEATLQVGYKGKEMYLIVLSDAKSDSQNQTLEKYHQITRDRMLRKMKNVSASESVLLTIDGHPALQDELSGTKEGTNVVFLHTTVDDGDHFQQILAWTLKSRWQQQNHLLREITQTFRSEN